MEKTRVEETVGFRRREQLPGVEVRDVENSARRWRCFSTGFEFLAPRTPVAYARAGGLPQ